MNLHPELINAIVFKHNEKVLDFLWLSNISFQDASGVYRKSTDAGLTMLTDRRIIFLQQKGLLSKKYNILNSIYYEDIQGFSISGFFIKSLHINSSSCNAKIDFRDVVNKETLKNATSPFKAMDKKRKFTAYSTAAHTLYEKSNPYLLPGPGGTLDLTNVIFKEIPDGMVEIRGSKFD